MFVCVFYALCQSYKNCIENDQRQTKNCINSRLRVEQKQIQKQKSQQQKILHIQFKYVTSEWKLDENNYYIVQATKSHQ